MPMSRRAFCAFAALAALAPASAAAQETPSGRPVPRYESLKFNDVLGREGPSFDHPILWRYVRRGVPVEVIAETVDWRKVRDPDGATVWMHKRTLDSRRTVVVRSSRPAELFRRPDADAPVIAVADPGVLFALERCDGAWMRVDGARGAGWIRSENVWGATCAAAG